MERIEALSEYPNDFDIEDSQVLFNSVPRVQVVIVKEINLSSPIESTNMKFKPGTILVVAALVVIVLTLPLLQGCTESEPVIPIPPGSRSYAWVIDTLDYPGAFQTMMRRLWGSTHNDVFVGGLCSDYRAIVWHYDGAAWSAFPVMKAFGGQIDEMGDIQDVCMTRDNETWIVGEFHNKPLLVSQINTAWERHEAKGEGLMGIAEGRDGTLIAVGFHGTMLTRRYGTWLYDSIPVRVPEPDSPYQGFMGVAVESLDEQYLVYYFSNRKQQVTSYLLHRSGDKLDVLDSTDDANKNRIWGNVYTSPSGSVYLLGREGVSRLREGLVSVVYPIENGTIRNLEARSDNDMIAVGTNGQVYHYNGSDWKQFEELYFPDMTYTDVLMLEKHVFISGFTYTDHMVSVVAMGTLK